MTLKKSEYLYYRKIYPGASVNCFTGSLCELFRLQGFNIEELDIYIIGNGFRFYEGNDAYSEPLIFYEIIKMVERFCNISRCSLNSIKVLKSEIRQQIFDNLRNKNLVIWVNSKHLQYSDLYYSESGYLHAIVLEKIINHELIRIRDSLIVSIPPVNCVADFHINQLEKSILDNLERSEIQNAMGYLHSLNINEKKFIMFDKYYKLKKIYKDSLVILGDFSRPESVILKYYKRCKNALNYSNNDRKIKLLQRMTRIIKTLWVIPNRSLFYKLIPSLNLKKSDEIKLMNSLKNLTEGWLILATFCLKCSVQSDFKELDSMSEYFVKVNKNENIFWNDMVDILYHYI